ncbi:ABC transporter permease [Alginatibacterium sediminis]|uniref:ABC transporter permease n=1 Tax=Alginatibacterium sediminis TaxID=2164068 RepID=A0A420EBP6_9ALTE|nr:ABC transporter permease [Alginatibacterium sediminis]RKF18101.1 ABC transporter permease [Alginatibacterium sediminis]
MGTETKQLQWQENSEQTVLNVAGTWNFEQGLLDFAQFKQELESKPKLTHIVCNAKSLGPWDSSLVSFLIQLESCVDEVSYQNFPSGVLQLKQLAQAVPNSQTNETLAPRPSLTERLGLSVIESLKQCMHFLSFWGECVLSFVRFFQGKANYRRKDFLYFLYDAGPASLPIVTLISLLIGMIMAFVGAVQLERFNAGIFVASMVGFAMAREMAAMMTAIIMAGRTGAGYAAQLGSMQVNEEIDALKTMGISAFDYLVLPRMLALMITLPLLTIYANLIGIFGGALVSTWVIDVSWQQFWDTMLDTVGLENFIIGFAKSCVFGVVVALTGCYCGMISGRSATAVGKATTSAVVLGIVLIISMDSIINFVSTMLGI